MMAKDGEWIQDLKGHSGCKVQLLRYGDAYVVRKTSASADYNKRLTRQIQKQQRLQTIIPVPLVLDTADRGGLASFDMEFISGRDFAAQCLYEPATWILGFTEQLVTQVTSLSEIIVEEDLSPKFIAKIRDIEANLATHMMAEIHRPALERITNALIRAEWSGIERTECHGDLTLENMILKSDKSITYIDVLDSDLESFWLDVAKLLFDLDIGWTLRHVLWADNGPGEGGRLLEILSRYIREEVEARIIQRWPDLYVRLPQLKALQAMRILPYTHDRNTFDRIVAYVVNLPLQKVQTT